jgi:hypothetical protein
MHPISFVIFQRAVDNNSQKSEFHGPVHSLAKLDQSRSLCRTSRHDCSHGEGPVVIDRKKNAYTALVSSVPNVKFWLSDVASVSACLDCQNLIS